MTNYVQGTATATFGIFGWGSGGRRTTIQQSVDLSSGATRYLSSAYPQCDHHKAVNDDFARRRHPFVNFQETRAVDVKGAAVAGQYVGGFVIRPDNPIVMLEESDLVSRTFGH